MRPGGKSGRAHIPEQIPFLDRLPRGNALRRKVGVKRRKAVTVLRGYPFSVRALVTIFVGIAGRRDHAVLRREYRPSVRTGDVNAIVKFIRIIDKPRLGS